MKGRGPLNEYLNDLKNFKDESIRTVLRCVDGLEIDVQAGPTWFSWPRQAVPVEYTYVEIATPCLEPMLEKYYVEKGRKHKFYPYVPVELVDEIIINHGGIAPII